MLDRKNRLTRRSSFSYVYKNGISQSSKILKIYFVKSVGVKIGFSVSNKVGKAVVRNKIKRRLRAATRELFPQISTGAQVVIVAKLAILNASYPEIVSMLRQLFIKVGLIKLPERAE